MSTLALAIGASVAAFAVVDKVLLRPLPVRDADHVVERAADLAPH